MMFYRDETLRRWHARNGDLVTLREMSLRQHLTRGEFLGTVVDAPEHDRDWLNVQLSDGSEQWFHRTQVVEVFRNDPEPAGSTV